MTTNATPKPPAALPDGILASDLKRPKWDVASDALVADYDSREFELWYTTGFGWCIPTLQIASGRHRYRASSATARTYAVQVKDKKLCRIGMGPHVTFTATVYVRKTRAKALAPFLALRRDGLGRAGQVRDRISSRRAQFAEVRATRGW